MKRILSFLLAMLMLIGLLPVSAMAAPTLPDTLQVKEVNPIYANQLKIRDLNFSNPSYDSSTYAGLTYYATTYDAGMAVREYLEKRDVPFTIGFRFKESQLSSNDAFGAVIDEIFGHAWNHTGVPTQGDYLRFQIAGWDIRGDVPNAKYENGYYYCSISYDVVMFTSASQEAAVDSRIDSLLTQLNPTGSDYAKMKTVYDWICANVTYDYANVNDPYHYLCHSAYAALIDKTAVCQGYTMLLYRLALELGIDSRAIPSIREENHIWNIIEMEERYYNTDSTWDAGNDPDNYQWFLRGSSDFPDHTREAYYATDSYNRNYPMGYKKYVPSGPPIITKQPQDVTVPNGETATVTVEAISALGITYQWYYKNPGDATFTKVPAMYSGENSNTYSVTMSDAVNGRQVYCELSSLLGSTTTNTVTLRKASDLVITQQPEKTVTVLSGETAKVTVAASGDGLKYQWYVKMPGSSSYVKGSQTGTTYSVTMNASRNGMKVCCKITDAYGRSVTSEVATLKQKTPLAITSQPVSVTVLPGETAKVTVKAVGDGLKYQWFVKMPGSSSYQKSAKTGTTYSVSMNDSRNGMKVCCKVTDTYGNSITSGVATLKQAAPLAITQQPKSVSVLNGETAKVTVKATGEGLQYQWYVKMPGSSSYVKGSQTGTTYSVAMTAARNGMKVCCKITDKYGRSITSEVATLNQTSTLAITQQPKSVTVLPGETAKVTVQAVGDGLKYQWFVKMPTSSSFTKGSQTGSTYSIAMNASRNGMQIFCKVTDKYGKSIQSSIVTLKQAAPLAITAQPQSATVAKGETARVTVKATGEGLTYQWFVKMPTSSSYAKGSQTGTTYSVVMTEARNGMKVCCKITDKYGRSITSEVATLQHTATPLVITAQPRSIAVLPGETAKATIQATGDGLKYQWFVKMPTSSSYAKSSQTGTTYSVQMTDERNGMKICCKVTDKYGHSITSEVAALKQATPIVITQQPPSWRVPAGCIINSTVTATGEGLQYQWFVKPSSGSPFTESWQNTDTFTTKVLESYDNYQFFCRITNKYGISVDSEVAYIRAV